MTQRLIASTALASVLALGLAGQVSAQDKPKEKCYGIAKAGQNDCANLSGSHSCAGQAKADMAADEWKYVAKGTCKDMKGLSEAEFRQRFGSEAQCRAGLFALRWAFSAMRMISVPANDPVPTTRSPTSLVRELTVPSVGDEMAVFDS